MVWTKRSRGYDAWKRGLWAEQLVAFLLCLKGYRIHERRFKTPYGEIDLIVSTATTLVFVEVKARPSYADAAHAVTPHQQRRLIRTAQMYLATHPTFRDVRFDVFLVKPRSLPVHLKNVLWSET